MKVVHIGDSDGGGGAAHAMSRLHEALQRIGVDSRVLVRNRRASGEPVATIATRGDADPFFPAVREAVVHQYVELNRTTLTNTHFSLHIDGSDLSGAPLVASADVVHLHWTASVQTPADIRALLDRKPVVWTLHDLEPVTGGCHFPAGCEGYADDCAHCPQLLRDPFRVTATTLRDKKALWTGGRPTFIAPSRYIAECARRSAVAQASAASIVHIPHGIDVETFRPAPKAAARRALGVPAEGLYVLCGSNYNAESRKGLDLIGRVLGAAKERLHRDPSELKLLTVGEPKLDLRGLDGAAVIQLGRVSADVMPAVYAAADIFLHPAGEDNFPLMLLESLSCGTPAIAFDIGGIPDIVQDHVSGRLAAAGDELAMAAALAALVDDRQRLQRMGEVARARVVEHFSDASTARKHAALYDDIATNHAPPRTAPRPTAQAELEEIFPRWSAACLVRELALARDRVAELAEESRAKDAALAAIHEVAEQRKVLAERLHASAASIEAQAASLQEELRERNELRAQLEATIGEQRAEIELIHRVAADRGLLVEDLQRATADQRRQLREKEVELVAIQEVADERKSLVEKLHASAASIEAIAAAAQRDVRARDNLRAELEATIDEQHAEIELVHRVAAERRALIEDLHRVAEERAALIDELAALPDASP